MKSFDERLPFVLRHSSIARVDGDRIYTLDRRKYPFEVLFYEIRDSLDIYRAIKDMVTQGGGPLELSLRYLSTLGDKDFDYIKSSVDLIVSARPTNTQMKRTLYGILERFGSKGIKELAENAIAYYDFLYDKVSDYGETLIDDGDSILTTCFAEHTFFLSLIKAREKGKNFRVYVSETRPYMQGSRLTEPSLRELSFDAILIPDSVGPHLIREGKITKYMTASDLAFKSLKVVNKIGTLSNAIAAKVYSIPYYAFSLGFDDRSEESLVIEERDGDEAKRVNGVRIASRESRYLYPAFDVVDPEFVSAVVTPDGIYRRDAE